MFHKRKHKPEALDQVVMHLTKNDPVTLSDLLTSFCIYGRSGSGKTSSSGSAILWAVISVLRNSGGLITSAKRTDRDMVVRMFRAAGREDDLRIFSPANDLRCNFIDCEMKDGAQTRNIVRCIMTIAESLRGGDTKSSGDDGRFFEREAERCIHHAVEVLRVARGHVDAPSIQKFISTAAYAPAQIASPAWQEEFHNQTLKAAFEKEKTRIEQYDFELSKDYWLIEFPQMADKTRSGILAHVMGILFVYNNGIVRELVSTTTNISPDDILQGKWVFVDLAPSEHGDVGTFISCGWKYLLQRRILRRAAAAGDPPIIIWCDEAQLFVNSFDADFLSQCRSHLGCMCFLTQSLHSYYAAMPGQTGKHQADALLTNFGHKIFHALGDEQSAEYAAGLIGKSLQTFVGASMAPLGSFYDEIAGRSQLTTSTSEHFEHILQPNRFMNGLRTGGRINDLICDAIVVRSGRSFANGANWIQVPFRQR
jgi:hypothetical protein